MDGAGSTGRGTGILVESGASVAGAISNSGTITAALEGIADGGATGVDKLQIEAVSVYPARPAATFMGYKIAKAVSGKRLYFIDLQRKAEMQLRRRRFWQAKEQRLQYPTDDPDGLVSALDVKNVQRVG